MPSEITPNSTFSQAVRALANDADKKTPSPMGQDVSELAHSKNTEKLHPHSPLSNKKQLNAAILQSALEFNETISDKPNTLLLKTALQGINEALKKMGVETSTEQSSQSTIDFSPEATAERIVSFSIQFLGAYQKQHPEMDEKEARNTFIDIVAGGIDQGFSEARDVLDGLKVLEGDIADNITKTYALVQEGLQSERFPEEDGL